MTIEITLIIWWFLFVALAAWILLRTRVGNWIFAVGRTRRAPEPSASP